MLKTLMHILRKADLVDQAIEETEAMFTCARNVYTEAVDTLKQRREPAFDIYQLDRRINEDEKSIRRKVLENLSINPRQDIVASLILTSIIIDIERIGDYSKNIYELNNLCADKQKVRIDPELITQAESLILKFDRISKAFSIGDTDSSRELMDELDPVRKGFDRYIYKVVNESGFTVEDAVINALFARYLKRVGAHLENVASAIANPFDRIGFYKKQEID